MSDEGGETRTNKIDRTLAESADAARCGCAGKTPLSRVVLPARECVATRIANTNVRLGPDADAVILPAGRDLDRAVDTVELDGAVPERPFGDEREEEDRTNESRRVWTLAAAFLGDSLADAGRLGAALGDAYAGLDGPAVTVGKGHAVQVSGASGGCLWLEHFRPASPLDGDGVVAANVDVLHAFPTLESATQARIAALNACNDVHAVGATTDRTVRPLVAAPAEVTATPNRVTGWYREGVPSDVTVLPASVCAHDGEGWLVGASVTARADAVPAEPPLPDDCGVLLTRPLGALTCFAHGVIVGDDIARDRGLTHLRQDTRAVSEALRPFRPLARESFDPDEHVAHVTDVSGEGITGVGRLAAAADRSLRLCQLPLLPGAEAAATAWTVPDVTVETTGPFAVLAVPTVLDRVSDRLRDIDGAAPAFVGTLTADGPPIVDAADADLSRVVEAAARWPTETENRVGSDG